MFTGIHKQIDTQQIASVQVETSAKLHLCDMQY